VLGRSMMESTEIAQDLGYIEAPPGLIINPGQMRDYPPDELLILISGTQGEPMSALSRAAVDTHKHAKIDAGDTVVLSSRIIPGNEKSIYRVIDHLSRREANVIFDDGSHGLIHVSGHGCQEELRLLINLVRPKFFIPIHGDYRNLRRHAQLAMETGAVEHAIVMEDGDVLELDEQDARKKDKVTVGRVLIDSGSTADIVEDLVVRDRRILSEDGIVLAILAINKRMGKVEREPEIVMRGFGGPDITEQAREVVLRTLDGLSGEQRTDYGMVKEKVRVELKRLIQKSTGKRPMIIPVILEI
jgi:ribonuclease J